MTFLSSTANKPLEFKPAQGVESLKFRMPTNKIGWLHTIADKPGAKFDIVVKDVFGRVRFEKRNCGNDTVKYGELINQETQIGEELHFSVENLKGADTLQVFVN